MPNGWQTEPERIAMSVVDLDELIIPYGEEARRRRLWTMLSHRQETMRPGCLGLIPRDACSRKLLKDEEIKRTMTQ
jgi:hypothetical protein